MKWFQNIRLSRKLNVSLICFLLLMVVMGVVSLGKLTRINHKVTEIQANWMPAAAAVAEMKNAFNDYRVAVLQYLMALDLGDTEEIGYTQEQMHKRLENYHRHERDYTALIVDDTERRLYERSRQVFETYQQLHEQMLERYRQDRKTEARALMKGAMREKKDEFSASMEALSRFQMEGGQRTAQDSADLLMSARRETFFLLLALALFEALGFYVVRLFARSLEYLNRAGVNTFSSTSQLAAVIQEQEATVGEQAASCAEIAASAKEISATARALGGSMDEIVHTANQTSQRAEEGQRNLAQLDETMRRMVEASNTITGKLANLNERASNINAVVNLITKIADQTHLLSLNAAIESERAGEYGLGFSVVATEIRRLSDQTSVATFDIEQILKEMQSSVSASVMGMDKFADEIRQNVSEVKRISQQLTEITEQTRTLSPRFETLYEGMQAQQLGTEQITESMAQFNEGLQQTAESVRNSRQTVSLLNEASRDLRRVIETLG